MATYFSESDIRQVTETVWDIVLHMAVESSPSPHPGPAAEASLAGTVHISGAWNGDVTVWCDRDLARRAAAVMFNVAPEALPPADVRDAVGELANMVGGNVRALLPEPCHLSLPDVVEGRLPDASGGRALFELGFRTGNSPFCVRLVQVG